MLLLLNIGVISHPNIFLLLQLRLNTWRPSSNLAMMVIPCKTFAMAAALVQLSFTFSVDEDERRLVRHIA